MRVAIIVVCTVMGCAGGVLVAQDKKAAAKKAAPAAAPSDAAAIKKAISAAPASIGKDATIVGMDEKMNMRTIRKGTNGFTCMVAGPGPDAMCADQNAMAWFDAYMNKKDPPRDKIGFVYMLAGDSGASNTDPFAEKATPTNNWVTTGPHVMIVGGKGMTSGYVHDAKADPTGPYVMWAGTPYEHLMLPVK
ncbi:MAG TPA: hypothetical protein VGI12_15385 [Vicinamibacterales bacterium]